MGIFAYESIGTRGLVSPKRREGGFSPIFITAGLAVLLLLGTIVWQTTKTVQASQPTAVSLTPPDVATSSSSIVTSANATSTTVPADPISTLGGVVLDQLVGAYQDMQSAGTYSTTTAQQAAESLAPYVTADVSYPTFSASDIKTDADTSYARMLQYRSDLQASLAPLLKNTEPEYEIFAYYVETKDVSYLAKLTSVAADYRDAASSTAKVVVPADAVSYHVAILNAMEEFAATLDALVAHANDPFASVALLRSYDTAEADMLGSFNDLTTYYKSKTP